MNDRIFREEQIQNNIYEDDRKRIRVGITNIESEPVPSQLVMSIPELLRIAISSGIVEGENYDEVFGNRVAPDSWILEFQNEDIAQFQVLLNVSYPDAFSVKKRPAEFPMLQENGDFLLLENGDKLFVQGLIPE